jgi:hypothetical protein
MSTGGEGAAGSHYWQRAMFFPSGSTPVRTTPSPRTFSNLLNAEATYQWDTFLDEYVHLSPVIGARPVIVLNAVIVALLSCAGWGRLEGIIIDELDRDGDIDPWSSDTAGSAALAYASSEYELDADSDRRLEFWRWWLGTAIPTAWQRAGAPVHTSDTNADAPVPPSLRRFVGATTADEPIPIVLAIISDKLLGAIDKHPQHALTPFYRQAVYEIFDPSNDARGRRRRGWLALFAARFVLPVWQKASPGDTFAVDVLTLAERALREEIDPATAEAEAARQWQTFTDDYEPRASLVGERALLALKAALETYLICSGRNRLEDIVLDEEARDGQRDPRNEDAAGAAAAAYAGPLWDAMSDKLLRLRFWQWWLHTAVPRAWQQAGVPAGPGALER